MITGDGDGGVGVGVGVGCCDCCDCRRKLFICVPLNVNEYCHGPVIFGLGFDDDANVNGISFLVLSNLNFKFNGGNDGFDAAVDVGVGFGVGFGGGVGGGGGCNDDGLLDVKLNENG